MSHTSQHQEKRPRLEKLPWRRGEGRYSHVESTLWWNVTNCDDTEAAMLLAKLTNDDGAMEPNKKWKDATRKCEYTAKEITSKTTGKTLGLVERVAITGDPNLDNLQSEEQIAASKTVSDWVPKKESTPNITTSTDTQHLLQDGKPLNLRSEVDRHLQNLETQRAIATALNNINDTLNENLKEQRRIAAALEVLKHRVETEGFN